MTTDDKLLLADLERIASDVEQARELEAYEGTEYPGSRVRIEPDDLACAVRGARRACRDLEAFRERLARRLKA